MNQHDIFSIRLETGCSQKPLSYGELTSSPTLDDRSDLRKGISCYKIFHIANPIRMTGDEDIINFRMLLEVFDGMYDDFLTFDFQELLGAGLIAHP